MSRIAYIRLIRDKATGIIILLTPCLITKGMSKGLALIKMASVEDVVALFAACPVVLIDGSPCRLEYGSEPNPDDWYCRSCGALNYHWRITCFKCHTGKQQQAVRSNVTEPQKGMNDGTQDICDRDQVPTSFLLVRGIPVEGLNEKDVFEKMAEYGLDRVWLARDRQTYKSRGFSFLQFKSSQVSVLLFMVLKHVLEC